jgi:hypothetical protein
MGCHPPYPAATSARDIVSEAELRKIAILEAISLRAIRSFAKTKLDILPLEESDVTSASAALAAMLRLKAEESDRDKLSDALLAYERERAELSERVRESRPLTEYPATQVVRSDKVSVSIEDKE